jgi:hypothetical protein
MIKQMREWIDDQQKNLKTAKNLIEKWKFGAKGGKKK